MTDEQLLKALLCRSVDMLLKDGKEIVDGKWYQLHLHFKFTADATGKLTGLEILSPSVTVTTRAKAKALMRKS